MYENATFFVSNLRPSSQLDVDDANQM